eukprot:9046329-Alexandrium_andersonii.AAC.1
MNHLRSSSSAGALVATSSSPKQLQPTSCGCKLLQKTLDASSTNLTQPQNTFNDFKQHQPSSINFKQRRLRPTEC